MKNKIDYVGVQIAFIVLLIGSILFRRQLFQGYELVSLKLNSDLVRANLPTYISMYDLLFEGTEGLWSWRMGIGNSMVSHFDVFFDPFTYIMFLAGRSHIGYMMVWSMLIKIVAEGIAISYYLRLFTNDKIAIIFASVLYSFSGYSLIMGNNLALGTILVYAPIVFCGIEDLIRNNGKKRLIISLFFIAALSFYYFYVMCALSGIYIVIRSFGKSNLRKIFQNIVMLVLCCAVACLLASFSIFPQVFMTLNNSRVGTSKDVAFGTELFVPQLKSLCTFLVRLIGVNTLKTNYNFLGVVIFTGGDYFQNEAFISCLFPLCYVQLLHLSSKKERKYIIGMTIICLLSVSVPFFSYAMNAFSTINMRWIFVWHIMCCLTVALCISKIREKNTFSLITLFLSELAVFVVAYFIVEYIFGTYGLGLIDVVEWIEGSEGYYQHVAYIYGLIFVAACIVKIIHKYNLFYRYNIIKKGILFAFIISIMISEVIINYGHIYINKNNLWAPDEASRTNYFDESYQLISSIQSDDSEWFRLYKEFDSVYDISSIPSYNDSMAQKYYGIKSYNSNNNSHYIDFLKSLGIYLTVGNDIESLKSRNIDPESLNGQSLNYINGVDDKYELLKYFGVKYYLQRSDVDTPEFFSNYEYFTTDGINVYIINDSYPLSYIMNNYMPTSDYYSKTYEERLELIMHTVISDKYSGVGNEIIEGELIEFDNDKLVISVNNNFDNQQVLCTTIPYDKGWSAYVNGEKVETEIVNIGMLGIPIKQGNNLVEIKFVPQGLIEGLLVSFFMLVISLIFGLIEKKNMFVIY